jgi:hypothetical protein
MAPFYDIAGSMQQADPVGAYQRGLMWRQQMQELARARKQQDYDDQTRQGLMQFWKQAQPERVEETMTPALQDLSALARPDELPRTAGGGLAPIPGSVPTMTRKTIPASPASFDYQAASNYLASRNAFDKAGDLLKLQQLAMGPASEYGDAKTGINPSTGRPGYFVMDKRANVKWLDSVQAPVEPGKVRERYDGSRLVQEEFDPATGQWSRIGSGGRWAPQSPTYQIVPGAEGYYAFNTKNPSEAVPLTGAGGKPITKPTTPTETTEGERKAAASGLVMDNAEGNFVNVNAGKGMSTKGYYTSKVPGGEYVMSKNDQLAKQAMIDWYREKLRLESGATIGDSEAYEEAKRYFPVPGEDEASIRQKAAARKVVMDGLRIKSGRAAPPNSGGAKFLGFE